LEKTGKKLETIERKTNERTKNYGNNKKRKKKKSSRKVQGSKSRQKKMTMKGGTFATYTTNYKNPQDKKS